MAIEDRFMYTVDDQGVKQDADVHNDVLDNVVAGQTFAVQVIYEHVKDGNDFVDAVALFGGDDLREALARGDLTWEELRLAAEADG